MNADTPRTLDELVALGAAVGRLLLARGWLLSMAESCTGGLVGHILTETAGSSAWFAGGAVTYSNEAKVAVLQVSPHTLAREGAVSATCAAEMAAGALRLYNTQVALSVTGIAGPGGGSPEKPVGLTFVGLAARTHVVLGAPGGTADLHFPAPASGAEAGGSAPFTLAVRHVWSGDRSANKLASAHAVLHLLERVLAAEPGDRLPAQR